MVRVAGITRILTVITFGALSLTVGCGGGGGKSSDRGSAAAALSSAVVPNLPVRVKEGRAI